MLSILSWCENTDWWKEMELKRSRKTKAIIQNLLWNSASQSFLKCPPRTLVSSNSTLKRSWTDGVSPSPLACSPLPLTKDSWRWWSALLWASKRPASHSIYREQHNRAGCLAFGSGAVRRAFGLLCWLYATKMEIQWPAWSSRDTLNKLTASNTVSRGLINDIGDRSTLFNCK